MNHGSDGSAEDGGPVGAGGGDGGPVGAGGGGATSAKRTKTAKAGKAAAATPAKAPTKTPDKAEPVAAASSGDGRASRGPDASSDQAHGADQGYVVLARKYRPRTFDDLIGQQAMVTTLRNAFATDRIAQGYMLTGVRGVGKTTTARILARALNYEPAPETAETAIDKPTIDMPHEGAHCRAIMESRHTDVMEMDAASNTGIDNIREIIESARYRPLVARYKVFIIDEVHMLSKGAFNALLKTLEEPPPHVKFIFATTEIRKVPVTVLSRCQRFDLRRVEVAELMAHFARIVSHEGASADDDALRLIARAAEGSVRDGLSILDQAIAMGEGHVDETGVRAMLGLADRGRIFDLAQATFQGDTASMLEQVRGLTRDGAEPAQIIADLADVVHAAARQQAVGEAGGDAALSGEERRLAQAMADQLSMPVLARAWQMLSQGHHEVQGSPMPFAAAEMVLIRLAYVADAPTPDEVIALLGDAAGRATGGAVKAAKGPASNAPSASRNAPAPIAAEKAAAVAREKATASPPSRAELPPPAADDEPPPWVTEGPPDDAVGPSAAVAPAPPPSAAPTPTPPPLTQRQQPAANPHDFEAVVDLVRANREAKLAYDLETRVSLVAFQPGQLDLHLLEGAPATLPNALRERLNDWTGTSWVVALSNARGAPPLAETKRERAAVAQRELEAHATVQAVLQAFPGATVKAVQTEAEREPTAPPTSVSDARAQPDTAPMKPSKKRTSR
ncbi:MAG: DNA polymerase III subunit gamma/tau [Pseudomonadota bacterium]